MFGRDHLQGLSQKSEGGATLSAPNAALTQRRRALSGCCSRLRNSTRYRTAAHDGAKRQAVGSVVTRQTIKDDHRHSHSIPADASE